MAAEEESFRALLAVAREMAGKRDGAGLGAQSVANITHGLATMCAAGGLSRWGAGIHHSLGSQLKPPLRDCVTTDAHLHLQVPCSS